RQRFHDSQSHTATTQRDDDESLFVGGNTGEAASVLQDEPEQSMHPEEADDLSRAIAMSLKNKHDFDEDSAADEEFEDVPEAAPEWTQKAVKETRPIMSNSGSMIAHIVNNRASAAVPKRREAPNHESDSEEDMQTVLARSRKAKAAQPKPVV